MTKRNVMYHIMAVAELKNFCVRAFLQKGTREFWKFIQKLGPRARNDIPWEVYGQDGEITSDRSDVLNKWKSDYFKLYNEDNGNFDDTFRADILNAKSHYERDMQDPLFVVEPQLNRPIQIEEVRKAVGLAKNRKAVGTDNIPNEVLKSDAIIGALYAFFQLCFDSGRIPSIWTQSVISPIPKNRTSDPRVPLNYRGISLLSCVYKIYSSILNHRLITFFDDNNIIHDEQNGFRGNRSCIDHIYTLSSIIKNKLNQKKEIFACYVDFRKAFDLLDRDMMLYRFLEYGINGKFYESIKGIYHRAFCAVKINGILSEWFESKMGTKQGDNLSPNCFSIYLNPLLSELKASGLGVSVNNNTVSVLAYADDLVLIAENEVDLQSLINILQNWCYKWRLCVNVDKTKIMHFRNKDSPLTKVAFVINGQPLECVEEYKYLGIMMDQFHDFVKTAELLAASAGRALGSVINKVKANKDLGFNSYTTLVDNCVAPILLYGSSVWGSKTYKVCENVLLRACRFYSGVHRLAPIPGIQGDFGWLDVKSRWTLEAIRLYNRFIKMSNDRLNKKVFLWDKSLSNNNWSSGFKNVLTDLNLDNHWANNTLIPMEIAKSKIRANFVRDWQHHCQTKDKLRTYRSFKTEMGTAAHLNSNLPKFQRSLISQLRLGILPIRLETGRFSGLNEADRICQVCDQTQIENEAHFMFHCNFYEAYRNELETGVGADFSNLGTTEKFHVIFQHPYKLGRYIEKAFQKRREKLYKM